MSKPKYSILLPSYKEAENLQILLPKLIASLEPFSPYEIIVLDAPQSLDNTREVCQLPNVVYAPRSPGSCYGDAIRTGFHIARGEFIICMDADGSHPPEFLPALLQQADNYDLVIASRYVKDGESENSALLIGMSKLLNWIYSRILRIKIKDISSGFRCYRAEVLKHLHLKCQNFDIIQEIVLNLIKKNPGLKIKEVPFHFQKRLHGESKRKLPLFIYSYFKTLIKLYRLSN